MTGLDWIVAPLALICFALSLGVVPWFVPEPDLFIVCAGAILMAAYDFWRSASRRRNNSKDNNRPIA
jgi:hypothetical protein